MGCILSIETTTSVCSVALAHNGRLLSLREIDSKNSHAEVLNGYIMGVLTESNLSLKDLNAVAVSEGPGSYTGLRIGVSTAKGLCYSLDIPLISVPTLYSLAKHTQNLVSGKLREKENILYCPMIDARRMEAYTAHFNFNLEEIRKVESEVIDQNTYNALLHEHAVVYSGDGCAKFKTLYINNQNAYFFPDILSSAKGMIELAEEKLNNKDFVDLAYFEPYYFKAFLAGLPKIKGLR
jgi:tRNA threonylcarbamoyladenosine biosynthesis protein TsaB